EALRSLHSEFIVAIEEELTMHGRTVLVLQKAGDKTLTAQLRTDGVPTLEMLARYGDDLLSAVAHLERRGVVHRDIKPDNIGIRSLTKQRNQLVLFDFSLTGAPLDNIRVGTSGYTDPFLVNRKPQRWDLAAERYSVGVTLYEMTLGDGVLPQWGDGKSDPALTEGDLVLDVEKFDPSVREGLVEFFHTALHRDSSRRYDNAEEMLRAWRQVFDESEQRTIKTPGGEEVDLAVTLEQADLKTPIAALGLSTRAINALERAEVLTVRNLLEFPVRSIHVMRGVGNQTRQEIIRFISELRERFPTVEAVQPKNESSSDVPTGPPTLEALQQRIVGVRSPKKDAEWNIRAGLLGMDARDGQPASLWPSQSDIADAVSVTRARIGQVLTADRARWAKDPLVTSFRHELCEQIQRLGGVVTVSELIELTILIRPPANTPETIKQHRLASAVARAAVETETLMAQPRLLLRRIAGKTVVACSPELAVYADKLGQVADDLASNDPLPPPLRAFQELYEVAQPSLPPGCQPFSNERLLKLAASMSKTAAVSSRQELYPRGMAADRTLRLGIGALSGLGLGEADDGFTPDQVRARVESRYPEAERLPDHPELQRLLEAVGMEVRWDAETRKYHRPEMVRATSGSSQSLRLPTAQTARHQIEVTTDVAEARIFEDRLKHAHADGGFVVLTVKPSKMRSCEAELMRRFKLDKISFDRLLFDALRAEAEELEIEWATIESADGMDRSGPDWDNLLQLVARIAPKLADDLAGRPEHLLLVHPGMIARYDQMAILETLRDKIGHDSTCPGLWLLVATDGQTDMPKLDHAEIPLITTSQRAKVSEAWIDNLHRGRAEPETAVAGSGRKGSN
ncbi:MAG: protein kinase domain-containing protein, partial [Gemmataceae bacterium]